MDNVKQLQNKLLEIYLVFKNICDDNNLKYFAIGGTCLGAIRHKGFIPWDDDIDIAMPRKDYETFKKLAYPDGYELFDEYTSEYSVQFFSKFHDINTTFIDKSVFDFPDSDTGIFIDIMPLDSIPNKKLNQQIFTRKLELLYKLNRMQKDFGTTPKRYTAIRYFTKEVTKLFPHNFFKNIFLKNMKKYDYESNDYFYTSMLWSVRSHKLIFDKDWFETTVVVPFEKTTVPVPNGYDSYLSKHYGEYMKIPEHNEQESHDGFFMLSMGYKEYRQKSISKIEENE